MKQNVGTATWIKAINQRVNRNANFIGVFLGQTGSGKSYGALRLAELIDPTFTGERVCFKVSEFVEAIKDPENQKIKGACIILDEAGVSASSRNFQSDLNKVFGWLLQTCRFLNQIILITLPDISFLDKQGRILKHAEFHCSAKNINKRKKYAKVKALYSEASRKNDGMIYMKYERAMVEGSMIRVPSIILQIPSKELRKEYEAKRLAYINELYDSFEFSDKGDSARHQNLTPIQEKVKAWYEANPEQSSGACSKALAMDRGQVSSTVRALRKKGYTINDFKSKRERERKRKEHSNLEAIVPNKDIEPSGAKSTT